MHTAGYIRRICFYQDSAHLSGCMLDHEYALHENEVAYGVNPLTRVFLYPACI